MVIHLIQEIKRDIVYRRMNAGAHRQVNLTRLRAHLISNVKKTISLLQYLGTKNHQESISFLNLLEGAINERALQWNVQNFKTIQESTSKTINGLQSLNLHTSNNLA